MDFIVSNSPNSDAYEEGKEIEFNFFVVISINPLIVRALTDGGAQRL
jgi:hypothetical protein